ncbi:hypothetical protein PHYBLDRAFT_152954 [Phycomyces blakesleeanus NRRL 1555(-)]|uniref:Uncharacterized protein n=1 Tax=Phycomyces blakesleeanus (strain ATCC 8743b / DSM 1359 / FGSC 10004 / NBRC 33097 / NRRL 1555) TaxID=763407 RepID=A0A167JG90_PHYB8|nr:hypothetical protein PHYBLDRAFT_152954 [Phycomyces blakesleeanus NRRL 1555(-)]OAD65927.1 hypothetical protein PHYBLDRAFT_152954 [Phycomyces blakesleeanus NRRL 1555(-)]|eukprot:XP_018283967.1 hypothetical protein PHYBLDRAFT_152954 [Phycomyces blakesleeanus NRRL 1555(-)]
MSSNSTRNSTRRGRGNAGPSVHSVAAGHVQQANITPRSQAVNQVTDSELENRIIDLLVAIQSRVGNVYDNDNASTIAILDVINTQQLSAVSHAPASGSVLIPLTGQNPSNKMNVIVLRFINERMWKRNFISNDLVLIAENEAKKRWNTNERSDHFDNVEVINYLRDYILSQPMTASVWSGLVVEKIKNNYKYIYWIVNMTSAQATAKNRKACSNSRCVEIHLHHLRVYNDNWQIIDRKMGYKQGNLDEKAYECYIEKDVMSDRESDSKLNRLLGISDKIMQTNDELQVTTTSKSQMIRYLTSIKDTSVPHHLSAMIPEWAIQNK